MEEGKSTWKFPRAFWTGNAAELCERAAYYGTFIALRTYLIRVVGLDDVQAGLVGAYLGGWIYLVPFFTGALADRMDKKKILIISQTASAVISLAVALALACGSLLGLGDSITAGLLSGALTSPPTYAAAAEVCTDRTALARDVARQHAAHEGHSRRAVGEEGPAQLVGQHGGVAGEGRVHEVAGRVGP